MATRGKSKWEKYFSHGDVKTKTKNEEVRAYLDPYDTYHALVLPPKTNITVLKTDEYSIRYPIQLEDGSLYYVSGELVEKPKTNFRNHQNTLNISALKFLDLGDPNEIVWEGQTVPVITFRSLDQTWHSTANELALHIERSLVDAMEEAFYNEGTFQWPHGTPAHVKNELGVYLGEILFAAQALADPDSKGRCVHFPIRSNFKTFDSIVQTGEYLCAVSNKYGPGNAACLAPHIIDLPQSGLPSLVQYLRMEYGRHSYFKSAVMAFALNKVLGYNFDREAIESINASILAGVGDFAEIKERILHHGPGVEFRDGGQKFLEHWPRSLAAYACKVTADALRNDPESLAFLHKVITNKAAVKAKLNNFAWLIGEVKFDVQHFDELKLSIKATGSVTDFVAAGGGLSYSLVSP